MGQWFAGFRGTSRARLVFNIWLVAGIALLLFGLVLVLTTDNRLVIVIAIILGLPPIGWAR